MRCLWVTYRPDLSVRSERESRAADLEVQVLEGTVLRARDAEQASRAVRHGTSRLLVLRERIGGNEREGGAGVDDAGSVRQDVSRRAEPDRLVDAEEERSWRRVGNWPADR